MTLAIETEITPLRIDEYGTIRVGKTRVTLDLVIDAFNNGASPQEIVEMYDALDLSRYLFCGWLLSAT